MSETSLKEQILSNLVKEKKSFTEKEFDRIFEVVGNNLGEVDDVIGEIDVARKLFEAKSEGQTNVKDPVEGE